jgi:hypothetical protein
MTIFNRFLLYLPPTAQAAGLSASGILLVEEQPFPFAVKQGYHI